ncbi:MAG: hypothetical protein KGI90_06890 [Burkholderiales bacterium]|nr:hypothetical protein [Burkholderiales bacterium]
MQAEGPLFNPRPAVRVLTLARDQHCVVIDELLARPEDLVDWACGQTFQPPRGVPYPGLLLPAPAALAQAVADCFAQHARGRIGGRRTLEAAVRLAMVTLPPEALAPCQWQCHRDRIAADPARVLFAASVLYLFRDPALGGTSFYRPRLPPAEVERMVADSQQLGAAEFRARWGVAPGYMTGSNDHFERIAQVPAAWNRMILYDGGLFHSGDVEQPQRLSPDPARGRLTLNGFFTCTRALR